MTNQPYFPPPTPDDLRALTGFRHVLHQHPEVSGQEAETARRVVEALEPLAPDQMIVGLGGHGVAAVFDSGVAGPTVMIRSEIDALPIEELGTTDHRSLVPGVAHLCGHDGHSTILLGVGRILSRQRPPKGRVVLLFQPAEEDGAGAAAVIADPRYDQIRPDWAFSLHNAPELPFGHGMLGPGAANCASRGMAIRLTGSTAHASRPADGLSPMRAMAELMPGLEALTSGLPLGPGFTLVTLTHACLGQPTFGIAPGEALVLATLRTIADAEMADLVDRAEALVSATAARHRLQVDWSYHDVFLACTNHPEAAARLQAGMIRAGVHPVPLPVPWVASEDFGRYGLAGAKSAMVFLGSGQPEHPVHTPRYDFNDDLIPYGIRLFTETIAEVLVD